MKTKKALAVVLAVVMLVLPLAVSSFAATVEILANPVKTTYNDSEFFNPQGLVLLMDGEEITYSPLDKNFDFVPALNEYLTVDTTEIAVYYNNEFLFTIPVTVEHILDTKLTPIDTGHGNFCIGCGELHNFEQHNVEEWIPNDDGGIFVQQTQTGICTKCNAAVTENIPDSEKFLALFDFNTEGSMTELEGTVLSYIYTIGVSLIQMLLGIY